MRREWTQPNGRARRSPGLMRQAVSQDWRVKYEEGVAHSILARSNRDMPTIRDKVGIGDFADRPALRASLSLSIT
jgi:hypothetical protein